MSFSITYFLLFNVMQNSFSFQYQYYSLLFNVNSISFLVVFYLWKIVSIQFFSQWYLLHLQKDFSFFSLKKISLITYAIALKNRFPSVISTCDWFKFCINFHDRWSFLKAKLRIARYNTVGENPVWKRN